MLAFLNFIASVVWLLILILIGSAVLGWLSYCAGLVIKDVLEDKGDR